MNLNNIDIFLGYSWLIKHNPEILANLIFYHIQKWFLTEPNIVSGTLIVLLLISGSRQIQPSSTNKQSNLFVRVQFSIYSQMTVLRNKCVMNRQQLQDSRFPYQHYLIAVFGNIQMGHFEISPILFSIPHVYAYLQIYSTDSQNLLTNKFTQNSEHQYHLQQKIS